LASLASPPSLLVANLVKFLLEVVHRTERKARTIRTHGKLVVFCNVVVLVLDGAELVLNVEWGFQIFILVLLFIAEVNIVITATKLDIIHHKVSVGAIPHLLCPPPPLVRSHRSVQHLLS
jgi:uncharacterized membrane protein YjfL (UPF0719 family)